MQIVLDEIHSVTQTFTAKEMHWWWEWIQHEFVRRFFFAQGSEVRLLVGQSDNIRLGCQQMSSKKRPFLVMTTEQLVPYFR